VVTVTTVVTVNRGVHSSDSDERGVPLHCHQCRRYHPFHRCTVSNHLTTATATVTTTTTVGCHVTAARLFADCHMTIVAIKKNVVTTVTSVTAVPSLCLCYFTTVTVITVTTVTDAL
jgi:hypothetical protein